MKVTTTLMDVIQSELLNKGLSEFLNDGKLTPFDDTFQFIKKAMRYDDDVHQVVTNTFFQGFTFSNPETDRSFKMTFVNTFLNRQMKFQTVELFSSQLLSTVLRYETYISSIYQDMEKYFLSEGSSETVNAKENVSDSRYLSSDLPQNQINLNVEDTVLDYGNQNTISRNKGTDTGSSTTTTKQYNLQALLESKELIHDVFSIVDQNCFLQIW